jgi:23S rRNA (guanine2445-N2)-methyltransferase / 23S rRNA (guanine2069-N7)-methyltransferase
LPAIVRKRKSTRPAQNYTATCSAGMENLVKDEILSFGGTQIRSSPGAVTWQGSLESAYRACLWSRFSSRILMELATFPAPDTDVLYEQIRAMDWELHFNADATFAVYTTLSDSAITHSHFASLRVKDGIVDYFRVRSGRRPSIDVRRPGIRLNLHIRGEQAHLALDLSGDSLHRRGYRIQGGVAPLKESLAAAIATLSGVQQNFPANTILLDPMCGSGTLLIEAALILSDSAPGLQRQEKYFGFAHWRRHNKKLWLRLVEEALEREQTGQEREWPTILGYDADPRAVAGARKNVDQAGLSDRIIIKQGQLARLHCPGKQGLLLTNPPYGERLSEREAVKYLYKFLGMRFAEECMGWRMGFFSANPDLADMVGLKWQEMHSLYNGPIKCRLMVGDWQPRWQPQPQRLQLRDVTLEDPGLDFANRLRKNWQRLLPWAEENNIYCFRLYDADMPEFNLAVDVYERFVHVQEYAPPGSVDPARASARFTTALAVLKKLFGLKRSQLFIKTRKPQKGKQQYQGKKNRGKLHIVHEDGARFLVNFTDYLDTGLFLDHRKTRAMIGELAQGRTFLNLFGYTGTATVYAAKGGAAATTTVDISEKYLARTLANLSINGYGGPLHSTICSDVIKWLRSSRERFGLIFVDPPTFSNARHRQEKFSIQHDHEELLKLAMNRLAHKGTLIFSTNFRKFSLAPAITELYDVTEITRETLPRDFRRKGHIHCSYLLRHREDREDV